ncbi:hypothetical protein BDR03DRAFT_986719 [Suillus americanus]|nr:hypothetical protein BDR03DRAFT_986719 [Suillus americanus]
MYLCFTKHDIAGLGIVYSSGTHRVPLWSLAYLKLLEINLKAAKENNKLASSLAKCITHNWGDVAVRVEAAIRAEALAEEAEARADERMARADKMEVREDKTKVKADETKAGAGLLGFLKRAKSCYCRNQNKIIDLLDFGLPGYPTALALTTAAAERALILAHDDLIVEDTSDHRKHKITLTLNHSTNKMSNTGTAFSAGNWETDTLAYME